MEYFEVYFEIFMDENVAKPGHLLQLLREIIRQHFMTCEHREDLSMIFQHSGLEVRKNVITDIENTLNSHQNRHSSVSC